MVDIFRKLIGRIGHELRRITCVIYVCVYVEILSVARQNMSRDNPHLQLIGEITVYI